ncbi:SgcJ/EcaC family oxidoreductase [Rhizobium laguerreae]|uniref:SgcJ/EcaC family oxidoreductase n=1 Tax=Rhizobium laguerreae TaxID=1076926 RepID=A0AB35FCE7_9HYPH|nr:SgcJ/EcaC family oxidoreductase [Rhizobium laguerreae]MBY3064377.1 SgcJ/EcaC family oxidoreductase [Rhizobium laguerreae]MBY3142451.1 SgcJ/EcaC family oxidoreductase [Rhizobium laguerreae]MBY3164881.1 SgcJ/EcaC family oxidoreductase [Rhizobium laguerreae]MBY3205130.1 SgcJ/EcaC family oxidoreductase [Rhizobium laguerreae]MBY3266321.1 SgcJ/EcaC family oxidoreductase [Rhizobium laguerreae]
MRTIIAAALALGFVQVQSAAAAAETATCAPTSEAEIAKLFDRWNASLSTLSPQEVAKNYSEDSVLLATLSNKPRLTQAERIDYFEHFLANEPKGHVDSRDIKIGCNWAVDLGTYTFTMKNGSKVPARYTYTYEFKDGNWLITSHHSSMMPEK